MNGNDTKIQLAEFYNKYLKSCEGENDCITAEQKKIEMNNKQLDCIYLRTNQILEMTIYCRDKLDTDEVRRNVDAILRSCDKIDELKG